MNNSEDPLVTLHSCYQNHFNLDEIRVLISSGIDVNKQDVVGWTALMAVIAMGASTARG